MKKLTSGLCMFVFAAVVLISAAGCSSHSIEPKIKVQKLHEAYPGDIEQVTRIEIRNGGTGELRTFTDQQSIDKWIRAVRELELIPDPNQEDRTGYSLGVSLYERKELKLGFTESSIDGHYILVNEALIDATKQLYESPPN